jgi:hypothetical protein
MLCEPPHVVGQYHAARLQYLSRSGAVVGETFDLSVHGQRLDEVDALYFSNPAIKASVKTSDPLPFSEQRQSQFGYFSVHIPENVPPGRYEVYARGRHGLTNTRAFLISKVPNLAGVSISHDRNTPTALPKNQLVHAVSAANAIDWFTVDVDEGESLVIELLAQQLDSVMIGQLKLYDSDGQTVVASRGVDDMDPILRQDGLPAGQYLLAVHDFMYRGGAEFQYQLLFRSADTDDSLIDQTADDVGQLPPNWLVRASTLSNVNVSNAQQNEASPLSIEVPADLTHWFGPAHTDHLYQFAGKKGQQLAIDVVSQRVAEPTDTRLMIHRIEPQATGEPTLHQLAHIDDSPNISDGIVSLASKDPITLFSVPQDATYQLSLRDLDIGTSLRTKQRYRLRIRVPNPGFDLVAFRMFPANDAGTSQPFASKLYRGGAEMIRVFALRRDGWSGPIKINVEGLPEGVTCSEAVIDDGQTRTQLTLVASDKASGRTDAVRVIGQTADATISQQAVPVMIARAKGHGRNAIRTRVTNQLPVYVSEQDVSPLTLTLGDGDIAEVKKGAALTLPIRLIRREGGTTPCLFRPKDFPRGIAAGEVTIAADASEGKIELKPNGDTKPGTYSIWLQAETKIKIRSNPQGLQRAQAYRMKLQGLHDDPAQAANLEVIKAAIAEADKRVEAAKGAANEQEITVFIPTNHATIRVVQP